jgi:hypothetical protein
VSNARGREQAFGEALDALQTAIVVIRVVVK